MRISIGRAETNCLRCRHKVINPTKHESAKFEKRVVQGNFHAIALQNGKFHISQRSSNWTRYSVYWFTRFLEFENSLNLYLYGKEHEEVVEDAHRKEEK